MPKSNWNEVDTIVTILLVLMVVSAFLLPSANSQYYEIVPYDNLRQQDQSFIDNEKVAIDTPVINKQAVDGNDEAEKYIEECDDICQRDKRDLYAQESMANAAWAMFWVAFVSVWVGIGTLFLVWRTVEHTKAAAGHAKDAAKAANDTNEITKTAFLTDQRPWVNVDVKIVSGVTFSKEGMSFQATISLSNVGKSPATSVFAVSRVDAEEPERFKDLKTKMMTFWSGQRNIRVADPNSWGLHVGDVIFPGEVRKRTQKLVMSNVDLDKFKGTPLIMPGIIVACTYGPEPEGRYFSTVRLFHLNGPGAKGRVNPIPLMEVGFINPADVETSSVFSAAYAT